MSNKRRTILSVVLVVAGIAGLIIGLGPAHFIDRLGGRVDAVGTVQWGVSEDSLTTEMPIADGEHGLWKVDYHIDGSLHAGMILGSYREGQQITVSAPSDGSPYAMLHESPPLAVKILSWILVPLSLAAVVVGLWLAGRAVRLRDAAARAEAHEQLKRRYPQMFASAPQPGPAPGGVGGPSPGTTVAEPDRTPPPQGRDKPDFFAPYDL